MRSASSDRALDIIEVKRSGGDRIKWQKQHAAEMVAYLVSTVSRPDMR
jgi:two-component SAPR family response regulator